MLAILEILSDNRGKFEPRFAADVLSAETLEHALTQLAVSGGQAS